MSTANGLGTGSVIRGARLFVHSLEAGRRGMSGLRVLVGCKRVIDYAVKVSGIAECSLTNSN